MAKRTELIDNEELKSIYGETYIQIDNELIKIERTVLGGLSVYRLGADGQYHLYSNEVKDEQHTDS